MRKPSCHFRSLYVSFARATPRLSIREHTCTCDSFKNTPFKAQSNNEQATVASTSSTPRLIDSPEITMCSLNCLFQHCTAQRRQVRAAAGVAGAQSRAVVAHVSYHTKSTRRNHYVSLSSSLQDKILHCRQRPHSSGSSSGGT